MARESIDESATAMCLRCLPLPGHLLRLPDRRLRPALRLHGSDHRLLRRLQLTHVAHVLSLKLEGGAGLRGEVRATASRLSCPGGPVRPHGDSEVRKRAVEGTQGAADSGETFAERGGAGHEEAPWCC